MLAARTVLHGVDALVWGLAGPAEVVVTAVELDGQRLALAELDAEDMGLAREALAEAWERACWAPFGAELRAA